MDGPHAEGQIKTKADCRAVDSPKKNYRQICFVFFFAFHGKQKVFVCSFFGRIDGFSICSLILFDLYLRTQCKSSKLTLNSKDKEIVAPGTLIAFSNESNDRSKWCNCISKAQFL